MKTKRLINYSYNSTKNNISSHLESLNRNLNLCTLKFENVQVIGSLNISMEDKNMKIFCESYNLKRLLKVSTCYNNPGNLSCVDPILTSKPSNFQNSCAISQTKIQDIFSIDYTRFSIETFTNSPKVKLGIDAIFFSMRKNF